MTSKWTQVDRDSEASVPTMLAQAIIIGTVLSVGAICCCGFYLTMIGRVVALLPWMCMVTLIAVAFTYVVGFALLWCAEAYTGRMRERFKPFAYGVIGLIGYAVWGVLVMTTLMNSLDQRLNGTVLSNGNVIALAVNYAIFGFLAFALAKIYSPALAARKTLAFTLLGIQIVLAVIGVVVMVMVFSALYR